MDNGLTVEQLRKLREVQVAAARRYDNISMGLPPVDEDCRSDGSAAAHAVRPLEQRLRGRERLVVGGCLAMWLGAIAWGTIFAAPPVVHPGKHHVHQHHINPGSSIHSSHTSTAVDARSAVYAIHDSLETAPQAIFQASAYGRTASVTALDGSSAERGFLMGPFETLPGEWVSAWVTEEMAGTALGEADHVTEFTGDGVDADGLALPFPPLHVHHIHVARGQPPPSGDHMQQHWMETHGDYRLDPERGYTTRTPPGYCRVRGADPLAVWAQLVDARAPATASAKAASSGSKLKWWLRVRFVVSVAAACTPITKLIIWYPYSREAAADGLMRYDVGNTQRLTWWTVAIPSAGRLVPPAWMHAHRARLAGLLLLRGRVAPSAYAGLGADCARRGHAACASVDTLRAYVLREAGAAVICHNNASVPSYAVQPAAAELSGGGGGGASLGYFDRQGELLCEPHTFAAGDAVTVFAFSRSVWQPEDEHFTMHTMLFAHFEPELPTAEALERVVYATPNDGYDEWDLERATAQRHETLPLPDFA